MTTVALLSGLPAQVSPIETCHRCGGTSLVSRRTVSAKCSSKNHFSNSVQLINAASNHKSYHLRESLLSVQKYNVRSVQSCRPVLNHWSCVFQLLPPGSLQRTT
ncbi:hypothetical protein AMECASPLE_036559 [Ameca splendens]|uniref:Secreted protein n=1 Tax=Ameca splendens TaxID=208324 RepID=A0ABV0YIU2_9TELE